MPHANAAVPGRVPVIEALRGFAALAVALFHISSQLEGPLPALFRATGWAGLDAFFVISGFVVPYSLMAAGYATKDFPRFLLRRLIRLEPPYVASIVLVLLLWHASAMAPGFAGAAPDYSWGQVLSHLFYVIPLTEYGWLNPVYWTLGYEFVFYILMGLLYVPLMQRNIVWTAGVTALAASLIHAVHGDINIRICEFLIGIITFRLMMTKDNRGELGLWWLAAVALVSVFQGPIAGAASALTSALILGGSGWSIPAWCRWLGAVSYSLYLIHVPVGGRVVNLGQRFGDGAIYDAALLGAAVAVSLAFAAAFSWFIERPAIAASRLIRIGRR